jgi:DNA-binding NarL/FixJ family response regulator
LTSQAARKPTPKELQALDILARGIRFREIEEPLGLCDRAISGRLKRIRRISGGKSKAAALVYWGLTEMHIYYPKQNRPRPSQAKIDVVALLAQDWTHRRIAQELHLTVHGVADRIREARAEVDARTEAQLVAIYWTEDWIA